MYRYKPDPSLDSIVDDHDAWKLGVPKEKRIEVLKECHCEPTAAHLGRHKTYLRVALLYYMPTIHKDVTEFVSKCLICQQCKVERRAPKVLMGIRNVSEPWQIVSADFAGPFPRSPKGNKYLLIFMDYFTRWIECFAVGKAGATTVKQCLRQRIFMRYGLPDLFRSDNGTPFKNELVKNYCEEMGVTHEFIPPYFAAANPVERANQTIKTMIITLLEVQHSLWDNYLPEITFAYNTADRDSVGRSPAFLNFGREPKRPNTVRQKEDEAALDQEEAQAVENWIKRLEEMGQIHAQAAESARNAQIRQAEYYNAKRRDESFEINDKVWLKNRQLSSAAGGISAKLSPKFTGPFVVTGKVGNKMYQLSEEDGAEAGEAHVNHLKPYKGETLEKVNMLHGASLTCKQQMTKSVIFEPLLMPKRTTKKRRKNRVLVQRDLQTCSGSKMSSEQANADTLLNTLATDTVVPSTQKRNRDRPPKDINIVNDQDIQSREFFFHNQLTNRISEGSQTEKISRLS